MKDISVEYLGGSGFLVSLGDIGMLFDASETGPDQRRLPAKETLARFRKLYAYILGFDIPQPYRGVRMSPGDEQTFGSVTVHAYGSTDEGVSFLVRFAGITLFHAGDLNLWHWRDESSITEIEAAERAFYDCVAPIPPQKIDVAFFPVDPRQGSMYDAGAGYFIMTVKPKIFIPMHFQGRPDVAMRFAVTGETPFTRIVALDAAGDHIDLHLPEDEDSVPDQKLRDLLAGKDDPAD